MSTNNQLDQVWIGCARRSMIGLDHHAHFDATTPKRHRAADLYGEIGVVRCVSDAVPCCSDDNGMAIHLDLHLARLEIDPSNNAGKQMTTFKCIVGLERLPPRLCLGECSGKIGVRSELLKPISQLRTIMKKSIQLMFNNRLDLGCRQSPAAIVLLARLGQTLGHVVW